ncbi:hypothetical protein C499_12330 [Halogeometricum borinquense DSM 11551]|uniref:Uncharacterized protein n=1 Tax=Halogeometricum borinquense (strain ATCC 700274 / DSM 11551 / JCM 10706 / KCTC 4070 / PR3) TaxID=469382 RepID=E4NWD5_HALBP|nr:hypothetical protein Hbor_36490 [Halogeometricum borinquense DSM 11551]ELY26245.1 hypothetical protein C499_12330 [Halogeometricum borinquense DSM 11551]
MYKHVALLVRKDGVADEGFAERFAERRTRVVMDD